MVNEDQKIISNICMSLLTVNGKHFTAAQSAIVVGIALTPRSSVALV